MTEWHSCLAWHHCHSAITQCNAAIPLLTCCAGGCTPRPQSEVPKPSEGLEYTYARKPSQFDHEKKDLAHIWEVRVHCWALRVLRYVIAFFRRPYTPASL